jgi:hypothetical protein
VDRLALRRTVDGLRFSGQLQEGMMQLARPARVLRDAVVPGSAAARWACDPALASGWSARQLLVNTLVVGSPEQVEELLAALRAEGRLARVVGLDDTGAVPDPSSVLCDAVAFAPPGCLRALLRALRDEPARMLPAQAPRLGELAQEGPLDWGLQEAALVTACRRDREDNLRVLLEDGRFDPNGPRFIGSQTPLIVSAIRGRVPLVRTLLADPRTDPMYRPAHSPRLGALEMAVRHGHFEVAAELLKDPRVTFPGKERLRYTTAKALRERRRDLMAILIERHEVARAVEEMEEDEDEDEGLA